MPADRLLHPRLGHSQKVRSLSWFDKWVWTTYILAADDFGVMRATATALKNADDSLEAETDRKVQAALERVIASGLIRAWEHQGRRFVSQLDWQKWQHVDYPRETQHPRPPEDVLAACDLPTRKLFDKHPGGTACKRPKESPNDSADPAGTIPDPPAEHPPNNSASTIEYACARPRETAKANGLRLEANGSGGGAEGDSGEGESRAERVYARLVAIAAEHRHETLPPILRPADFPKLVELLQRYPDDALLDEIMVRVATSTSRDVRAKPLTIGWVCYWAGKCEAEIRSGLNEGRVASVTPGNLERAKRVLARMGGAN